MLFLVEESNHGETMYADRELRCPMLNDEEKKEEEHEEEDEEEEEEEDAEEE